MITRVGVSEHVGYSIDPIEAQDHPCEFVTGDPGIAVVNENGEVTGVSEGTTTITVKCKDLESTAKITVLPEGNYARDIYIRQYVMTSQNL